MQAELLDWMKGIENVLAKRNVDEKVIAQLTENNVAPEKFYLTGFESIVFNQNKLFALSVVLSSVIPFEKAILIYNTGSASLKVAEICSRLQLNYLLLDSMDNVEEFLKNYKNISHLFICEGDEQAVSRTELQKVGKLVSRLKVDLIVECMQMPLTVSQALDCGASFMVYVEQDGALNSSMVVCRRSRLVQAEGQCRWSMYDLYQYWQKTLAERNNVIEPMAV